MTGSGGAAECTMIDRNVDGPFAALKTPVGERAVVRIVLAIASCLLVSAAGAQSAAPRKATLSEDMRFCPSWAEAHERTLASLNNNGRRPPGARWKGCVVIKKGTEVEVVASDDQQTEIVFRKKHWFADQGIF